MQQISKDSKYVKTITYRLGMNQPLTNYAVMVRAGENYHTSSADSWSDSFENIVATLRYKHGGGKSRKGTLPKRGVVREPSLP